MSLLNASELATRLEKALSLHRNDQLVEAREAYLELLDVAPKHFDSLYLIGLIDHSRREYLSAADFFAQALFISPNHELATLYCGICLNELKLFHEAISLFDKLIALNSENSKVYFHKANALQQLGLLEDSLNNYNKSIELDAKFSEAFHNCGLIYFKLEQFLLAIEFFDKAISINAYFAPSFCERGLALNALKKHIEAIDSYDKAIKLDPKYADAYYNRGIALQALNQTNLAIQCYQSAINLNPVFSEAHNNLGISFQQLGQLQEAVHHFGIAFELDANYDVACVNLGAAYQRLADMSAAVNHYQNAFNLNPNYSFLLGSLILSKQQLCHWKTLYTDLCKLEEAILAGKKATDPFPALVLLDDPKLHQIAAQTYVADKAPANPALGPIPKRDAHERIRLGFYSADLRWHPVSIWLAEQVENHDKTKFELFAFSYRSDIKDPMQQRLQQAFDHFIEVDNMSDLEVATLSRQLEIDIALDLGGHTQDSRPGIFAARAAPIQVSHLGFPGSWGGDYIDYVLGDEYGCPPELQEFFTEKILHVPCIYTYDRQRTISSATLTRAEYGLPDHGFVFTCQNGIQKIHPEVFDIWMRLLNKVPDSVLWLQEPHPTAIQNLKKEAQARGVDEQRLIFHKRELVAVDLEPARIAKYLASYKLADLFLDTWPYNAGTTAVDALWAGLPVVTKAGRSAVSRMATSALHAIAMPELVTSSAEQYEQLVLELATNPTQLQSVKEKLARNKLTTALFDPVANTRHIEQAYITMMETHQKELINESS